MKLDSIRMRSIVKGHLTSHSNHQVNVRLLVFVVSIKLNLLDSISQRRLFRAKTSKWFIVTHIIVAVNIVFFISMLYTEPT